MGWEAPRLYQYDLADEPGKEAEPADPPVVLVPSGHPRQGLTGGDDGSGTRNASCDDSASPVPDWIAASYPWMGHSAVRLPRGVPSKQFYVVATL